MDARRSQRIPASAAAWLALVFLLPVAGTLLYVLAGYRRAVPAAESCDCRGDAVEQIVARGCGTRPAPRNSVSLLHNGSNAFTALIAALQHAVRSIHMEYYIIRDDRIGRTIAEILIRKARAGLEVRVIYDAVGSWRLSRTTLRRMHDAGVRTAAFEPVRFPWFTTRVSRRNHRKIVVTDGRVAFLGGINIAKYYLDGDYMGKWRDEHLRIEGDAVADLQRLFIADWARAARERLDPRRYIAPHRIRQRLPIQLAWSEEGPSRLTIAEAFAAAIVRAHDCDSARLIAILQEIQASENYLSQENMELVADMLHISVSRVYSVATFYENFSLEPKGKHIIKVCDGTACHVRKSGPIYDAIYEYLKLDGKRRTSADGVFTLETVACLGACGLAPVMTVDGEVYAKMTPETALAELEAIRGKEAAE